MSIWKDFVSGGLPAVLDMPEKARTAEETDGVYTAQPSTLEQSERYQPAAPGSGSAYQMPSFAAVPGGGLTVAALGIATVLLVTVIATR